MPKYPINDPLIDEGNLDNTVIEKKRYNNCCNNKNVCVILSTILCIVILIVGLTFINIYAIRIEDGSL